MKTLHGLRILNTRPFGQNQGLSRAIQAAGGVSIDCPALAIEPLVFSPPDFTGIDQMIFTSTNAVRCFWDRLEPCQPRLPESIRILAIGKASAGELLKRNIRVDGVPSESTSEHLLQLDRLQDIKNQTIVLVKGEQGRVLLRQELTARGAHVIPLDVYRRVLPQGSDMVLRSLWRTDGVDAIVLTSEQAMHHLFALFEAEAQAWLRKKPWVVISERLSKAAKHLGVNRVIITSYDQIVATLRIINDNNASGRS